MNFNEYTRGHAFFGPAAARLLGVPFSLFLSLSLSLSLSASLSLSLSLQQVVDSPTRGHNILDLFFVNKVSLVGKVQLVGTEMSDHDLVHVGLTFHPTRPQQRHRAKLEGYQSSRLAQRGL